MANGTTYLSMPKPAARRPGLFLAVTVAFGVLSLVLIPPLLVLGVIVTFGFTPVVQPSLGSFGSGLVLVVLVEFIAVMAISILAQFLNALTMFWRTVRASGDDPVGTFASFGRYFELLPYPTTRWSTFWTNVQERGWMQWRSLVAILALILIPFTSLLVPLRTAPTVFIPLALVLLGVAVYLAVAQLRRPPSRRRPSGVGADLRYEKGVAYRARKRAADLAVLKEAGLAAGAGTPAFDLWVHAEIREAFGRNPGAHLAIRNGDTAALAGPVRAVSLATEGLVSPDRLRELVADAAVFRRKSPTRKTGVIPPTDSPPSTAA